MRRSLLLLAAPAAIFVLALAAPARAGQVTILVGNGGSNFQPATTAVNIGDQVVWLWAGLGHTVTSGTAGDVNGTGRFRSGTSSLNTGAAYSWKVTAGAGGYYCVPHWPGMSATLNIVASGASVADFRITEVEFAATGDLDRVQISNLGGLTANLGRYRVSSVTGASTQLASNSVSLGATTGKITLHLNTSGASTATDFFLATAPGLPTEGSFALYTANTTTGAIGSLNPGSLVDPDQLVDYVEWGHVGQAAAPNNATAVSAGLWNSGDVVQTTGNLPNNGLGYSISFCGSSADHGASFWQISTPNFGTGAPCTTPTLNPTWGRLKRLYR